MASLALVPVICLAIICIHFIALTSTIIYIFKFNRNIINSNFKVILTPIAILGSTQILFCLVAYRQSYNPFINQSLERVLSFITTFICIGYGIWYLLMTYHLPKIFQPKDQMYTISTATIYSHRLGMILIMTIRIINSITKMKDVQTSNLSSDVTEIIIVTIGYSHMVWSFYQRLPLIFSTTYDEREPRQTTGGNIMIIGAIVLMTIHTISTISMALAITVQTIKADELYTSAVFMIHWRIMTLFMCYFWFYVTLMPKLSHIICGSGRLKSPCDIGGRNESHNAAFLV